MFKFNFKVDNDIDLQGSENTIVPENEKPKTEEILSSANEIINPETLSIEEYTFKPVSVENTHFLIRDFENEKDDSRGDEFLSKYYSDCDVTPSVYEGGLKIWECTYDLLLYLIHNDIEFANKTVLDLGCGCGILGMYASQKGAQTVHFHDYNTDVLSKFTAPNVTKNQCKSSSMFISGDWGSFCDVPSIQDTTYDFILSSETLYNPTNYTKLSEIFFKKLKKNGRIYLASKSYYFGVGGNTKQFLDYLDREQKFVWDIVWKNSEERDHPDWSSRSRSLDLPYQRILENYKVSNDLEKRNTQHKCMVSKMNAFQDSASHFRVNRNWPKR